MSGRYAPYSKYLSLSATWMDHVPDGWMTLPVGRLFRRVKRTGFPDAELLSVYRDYGVIPKRSRDDNFNTESEDLTPYQLVVPGDLVMNKMKAWQGSIGVSEFSGIVSPAYFVYEPWQKNNARVHLKYLHHLVRSPIYIAQYLRRSKGIRVNQWDLDPSAFEKIEVLLPTLDEQTQIAKFLDYETARIDALIEKQQQLIALLQEKRQAVISHAVTKGLNPDAPMRDSGVEWLGKVPAHWEVVSLKRFISTRKGAPFKSTDFADEGVQVVRASDVKNLGLVSSGVFLPPQFLDSHPRAMLRTGELILTTVGSGPQVRNSAVGQIGRVSADFDGTLLNQNTVVFSVIDNRLGGDYLFQLVQVDGYRDHLDLHAHGTANQASLNVSDMLNFMVPIPPTAEQLAIVEFVVAMSEKMFELERSAAAQIDLLAERRTALISAAVTGKIDVREWKPPAPSESIAGAT